MVWTFISVNISHYENWNSPSDIGNLKKSLKIIKFLRYLKIKYKSKKNHILRTIRIHNEICEFGVKYENSFTYLKKTLDKFYFIKFKF